jgi:hypothetical protein
MKYIMLIVLVVFLSCDDKEPASASKTALLTAVTWDLEAIENKPYDWQQFNKIVYNFRTTEVELSQLDGNTVKGKQTGKWEWLGGETRIHLDFRLPNGNGNQYDWQLISLASDELVYKGEDNKTYRLVPKK